MMYLKLAWRNIWRNKRRTWITVSAIGFAVFFSSLLKSSQIGSYDRMIDNVARFYTGYIQVQADGYQEEQTLDKSFPSEEEMIRKVSETDGVSLTAQRLESFALAAYGNQTKGALVLGIDPATETKLTNVKDKIIEGEYLSATDEGALVSEGLAKYLGISTGDTLVMISQGYRGVNSAGKYPVRGIVKFPAPDLNNQLVYLPLDAAQYFYGAEQRLTSLSLMIDDVDQTDQIVKTIQSKVDTAQYAVLGWEEMMPELVQQIELDYVGGLIMRYILYAVITFGIFGTFLMMVNERKYEFGIMMAIGMKRYRLQLIVFIETVVIALTGTLVGVLFSIPIITYFYHNPIRFTGEMAASFETFGIEPILPFSLDPSVFTGQVQVVLVIILFLVLYPLWSIYKLKINQAIRA